MAKSKTEKFTDIIKNVPLELKELDNWVLHKNKIPISTNSTPADTTNPATWSSFENVLKVFEQSEKYDGIGFVFTEKSGIVGIDIDKVISEEFANSNCDYKEYTEAKALDIVNTMASYTEISPSGKGLHIFVKGDLNDLIGNRKNGVEIYNKERYFTFTGNMVSADNIVAQRQAEIEKIHNKYIAVEAEKVNMQAWQSKNNNNCIQSNDTLKTIEFINRTKSSDKFNRLLNGNITGYKSGSEATYALALMVSFYSQGNHRIMREVIEQSALYRPKCEEMRGNITWLDKLISDAVKNTRGFAQPIDKPKKNFNEAIGEAKSQREEKTEKSEVKKRSELDI